MISAPEARNHLNERVTVGMTVRASKDGTHRKEFYLDAEEDYGHENNCAVVISYDHADKFNRADMEDPATYYRGKAIRVTGTIIR